MKVLFVNMPFNATRPAIGVSLLKGHLERMGVPSRIIYFNMQFENVVGASDYKYIAELVPPQSLAGDWIFSRGAFGPNDEGDAAYLQTFSQRFARFASTARGSAVLRRARDASHPFLQKCLDQVDRQSYDVLGFTSTFTQHL